MNFQAEWQLLLWLSGCGSSIKQLCLPMQVLVLQPLSAHAGQHQAFVSVCAGVGLQPL